MLRVCVLIATAASLSAQVSLPGSLANEMLAAHNAVRRQVGVPPLIWSTQLAEVAQEWADRLAARGQFSHRQKSQYGENLYQIAGAAATPVEVVNQWAAESSSYHYGSNTCRGVCGHYTQLVWRNTKRVGCAVARRGRTEVWVCNYDPPGNWIGQNPF